MAVKVSAPPEIVGEVAGCHTVETAHPGFESAAIGIDVLHVIDPGDHPNASGQIDRTMGDTDFAGHSNHGPAAVSAQNSVAGQYRFEGLEDVRPVVLFQNKVGRASCSITANQHRNLFVGQAAFGCLAATFARCSRHSFLLTLKRLAEKGFVCFGDAHQLGGFVVVGEH